ncbi:hypothetical protein QUU41_22675, partial [Xanthomonas citri pv. citri]
HNNTIRGANANIFISPSQSCLAIGVKHEQPDGHQGGKNQDEAIPIDPLSLGLAEVEDREQGLHGKSAHREPREARSVTRPAAGRLMQLKVETRLDEAGIVRASPQRATLRVATPPADCGR